MILNHTTVTNDVLNADYLHTAYLIDEDGNEVLITRDMINDSCDQIASNEATPPPNQFR